MPDLYGYSFFLVSGTGLQGHLNSISNVMIGGSSGNYPDADHASMQAFRKMQPVLSHRERIPPELACTPCAVSSWSISCSSGHELRSDCGSPTRVRALYWKYPPDNLLIDGHLKAASCRACCNHVIDSW